MIYDNFNCNSLDNSKWIFINMTTPCTEIPIRIGSSCLGLPEHDIWNEGNCLLSRCFLQKNSSVSGIFTGWDEECSGAGVGYYAGNGSFWGYVMLAATNTHIQLRVHSGSQNGESFMSHGQPKWAVIAEATWEKHFPVRLTLHRSGNRYIAELDGDLLLEAETGEIVGDARAMYKALPWDGRLTPRYAYLDWAKVEGEAPTTTVYGTVLDEKDGKPIPFAGVHVAGFDEFFVRADDRGYFILEQVPRGSRVLVAAAEGYSFSHLETNCVAGGDNHVEFRLKPETEDKIPRREYNRPAFDRSSHGWLPLNGTWEFCFDPENRGIEEYWYEPGSNAYDRHIRVPFSWASLMGFGEEHLVCGDTLHETNTLFNNYKVTGEYAWYRRRFTIPSTFPAEERVILHIGASANVTYVWLDGQYKGMRIDEYSDLEFDLGLLKPGSTHTLVVKVQYPHDINSHNIGKQIFWFASAPGIWQSVWLEHRKESYLTKLLLTPDLEFSDDICTSASVKVVVAAHNALNGKVSLTLKAPESGKVYRADILLSDGAGQTEILIDEPELWQYREGRLYEATALLKNDGEDQDFVKSYVGLRKVETRWLPGHSPDETADPLEQYQYLYLNGKPFYIIGVLDQGYNAFGIYTYRSLYAEGEQGPRGSIAYDIDRTMAYGYNLSRVHIKENEPLWYHECDKRGLPVWTEHPSNFYAVPEDPNWQTAYDRELDGMLERLNNYPSIIIVSTFNESWGITGGHQMSPWENELRYQFMESRARHAKEMWPHVIVCDNSGYGKTAACELNDFHIYPGEHWTAKEGWKLLMKDCYPGSTYNCINNRPTEHTMGDIVQTGRPVTMEHAIGNAVQTGRPIVISEFLHINGIDMQLRMFEKIAGYVRMNVGSHETEDSAPLTAERFERDYGYVDHHMNPIGYDMVNNMDMVVLDQNRIAHVNAGDNLTIDVFTSHFSWKEVKKPILHVTVTGIDLLGRYLTNLQMRRTPIAFRQFRVERQEPLNISIPNNCRGAYVFVYVTDGDEIICQNYVQLCIHGIKPVDVPVSIEPSDYIKADGEHVWIFQGKGNCATVYGEGYLAYEFTCPEDVKSGILVLEAGAREGKNAIKVTDECLHSTEIQVFLDGDQIGTLEPKDDASDERGLFSNAAQGGELYDYRKTGKLGYGERFEIRLPQLLPAGCHTLEFRCGNGGMTIYGSYTGRYGFPPSIIQES